MEIIVDGRLAALKKGSSFDYIAENRFFTDSDSYTLSMEFPLRGCPQNIEIFGHLHRVEVDADDVVFDCEIRDKLFVVRGTLTVVGMSEVEVKCQFLEGRSAQNFRKDLDEVYLNELQLFTGQLHRPVFKANQINRTDGDDICEKSCIFAPAIPQNASL